MKIAMWLAPAVLAASSAAMAQVPATVQLPTYSFFSVGTSVSVPDRGSAYLGGVNRASTGMNEFRTPLLPFAPFRNRSFGSERSASNMHVSAFIHDFEAMEEALLGQSASATGLQPRSAVAGSRLEPRGPAGTSAMSVADAQRERSQQQLSREEEADAFFQRGQAAEAAGKNNVAKIYYQMAARRASGELKTQVAARLEAIHRAGQPTRLAQDAPIP